MKKIVYSLIVCAGMLAFAACDDSVEDNSRLTYLVDLQVKDTVEHQVGTSFTIPQFTATENGKDVSSKVTVTGADEVDGNKIGIYPITYVTANADGIEASASQTIYVVNMAADTDISGSYVINAEESKCIDTATQEEIPFTGSYPLTVTKVATGIFTISDVLGGWLNLEKGLGSDFAVAASCSLDNAVTADQASSRLTPLKPKSLTFEDEDGTEKTVTVYIQSVLSDGVYRLKMSAIYDGWQVIAVAEMQ